MIRDDEFTLLDVSIGTPHVMSRQWRGNRNQLGPTNWYSNLRTNPDRC